MIYFKDIKLESRTKAALYSENLAILISEDYHISFDKAFSVVKKQIKRSNSHVEFLIRLKKEFE